MASLDLAGSVDTVCQTCCPTCVDMLTPCLSLCLVRAVSMCPE